MENQLQIYNSDEFGQVRVVMRDGEPWFVAKDVCRALEIGNPSQALGRLDDDEKCFEFIPDMGIFNKDTHGGQQMLVISEGGMYALAITSRKPQAKKFRKWLTGEVAVSIRKDGVYMTPDAMEKFLSNPDFIIELATRYKAAKEQVAALTVQNAQLAESNTELALKVEDLEPDALYCRLVLQCPDLVSTTVIAKDYGMSARAFNALLRKLGVHFKQGDTWVLYQKYAALGWAATKTHVYADTDGKQHSKAHTYWTQKGRMGLYHLLKENGILPTIEKQAA